MQKVLNDIAKHAKRNFVFLSDLRCNLALYKYVLNNYSKFKQLLHAHGIKLIKDTTYLTEEEANDLFYSQIIYENYVHFESKNFYRKLVYWSEKNKMTTSEYLAKLGLKLLDKNEYYNTNIDLLKAEGYSIKQICTELNITRRKYYKYLAGRGKLDKRKN